MYVIVQALGKNRPPKKFNIDTLQETNISPWSGMFESMLFLFPRWDMLVSWRVPKNGHIQKESSHHFGIWLLNFKGVSYVSQNCVRRRKTNCWNLNLHHFWNQIPNLANLLLLTNRSTESLKIFTQPSPCDPFLGYPNIPQLCSVVHATSGHMRPLKIEKRLPQAAGLK